MKDFDTKGCSIGDPYNSTGDRIPKIDIGICRTTSSENRDSPAWKLAELLITNCGITVTFEGLSAKDLQNLADFLNEYAQRLREF